MKKNKPNLSNCILIETGGMKGKRKEMSKQDLHQILKKGLMLIKYTQNMV
jgi:hypothetical protein